MHFQTNIYIHFSSCKLHFQSADWIMYIYVEIEITYLFGLLSKTQTARTNNIYIRDHWSHSKYTWTYSN